MTMPTSLVAIGDCCEPVTTAKFEINRPCEATLQIFHIYFTRRCTKQLPSTVGKGSDSG